MKKLYIVSIAFCALFLLATTAHTFPGPGQPIDGTDVGLDHTPPPGGAIYAHARTNHSGDATFTNLKPGTYTFKVTDASLLGGPCRIAVTSGREKRHISERILPGKKSGAPAYAIDSNGRQLTVVIDKPGNSITLHLQADK